MSRDPHQDNQQEKEQPESSEMAWTTGQENAQISPDDGQSQPLEGEQDSTPSVSDMEDPAVEEPAIAPHDIRKTMDAPDPDVPMESDIEPCAALEESATEPSFSSVPLRPVRFIHAADLHLDAVFAGISRDMPSETARRMHQATFAALENLFSLCERVRPDFLLLAGDIYNQEDRSLAAQLAVRDGCVRLDRLDIQVYAVHGNHDPLSSRLRTLQWPKNVTIFGEKIESHIFSREEIPLAVIHGASHAGPRETRNLATSCVRSQEPCLHIGLLHTTLGDTEGARYAPCSLEDLKASGLDYWALGHIHDRRVICEQPLAQYSGSTQGLHINESGSHGCLVVSAQPEGDGFTFTSVFQPLGPVEWHTLLLNVGEESSLDELENQIRNLIAETVTSVLTVRSKAAYLVMPCEALILRVRLVGRTRLDAELRRPAVISDILGRLRDESSGDPLIWVKDIEIDTRPVVDRAVLLEREDLLGEILRMSNRLREDAELRAGLAEAALSDLYGHARARKALSVPSDEELLDLLLAAETTCLDLLENE